MKKSFALSIILLTCTAQVFANPAANAARSFLGARGKVAGAASIVFGLVYYGEYACSKSAHHKEIDALFGVGERTFELIEGWARWGKQASQKGRQDLTEAEARQAKAILAKAQEPNPAATNEPTAPDQPAPHNDTPPANDEGKNKELETE